MPDRSGEPVTREYLAFQYDDAEKLRARYESHARYSEAAGAFTEWLLPHLELAPGLRLLDVGCGPGPYHPALIAAGVDVAALDQSEGMLREVRAQAISLGTAIHLVRAGAEALPFADAAFDRVMANHMLYYVADQRGALREMRRTLRPGGRVVLATNGRRAHRLHDIHSAAARALGYRPEQPSFTRFTLDDIDLVRSVLPAAEVYERVDAFVFPDAASALRYYASGPVDSIAGAQPGGAHRARMFEAVGREIEEIIAREGVFRVPKSAGCFVAGV